MKTDLYTKSVLTIIAGALLWLGVQHATSVQAASAQDPTRVVIVGLEESEGAKAGTFLKTFNHNGLPVAITYPVRNLDKPGSAVLVFEKGNSK